jgi:WD40 repeat protein
MKDCDTPASLAWDPTNGLYFAAGLESGLVGLFDTRKLGDVAAKSGQAPGLLAPSDVLKIPVRAIEFSPWEAGVLAVACDDSGTGVGGPKVPNGAVVVDCTAQGVALRSVCVSLHVVASLIRNKTPLTRQQATLWVPQ